MKFIKACITSIFIILTASNSASISAQQVIDNTITKRQDCNQSFIVNLDNYKEYESLDVTIECLAHKVTTSKSGNSMAVMFEDKSWTNGFKLVFFADAIAELSPSYIRNLAGKTITVRGLITKHKIFGYQIIFRDSTTILNIK
jgi:hypothetical protein